MRALTIHSVLNGYVVHADCQFIVFENKEKLLDELRRYLDDPEAVEAEYITKATNGYGRPKVQERPECASEAPRATRRGLVEALGQRIG